MSATKEFHQYPLRIPMADVPAIQAALEKTGLSVNQLVTMCLRRSLPVIVDTFRPEAVTALVDGDGV